MAAAFGDNKTIRPWFFTTMSIAQIAWNIVGLIVAIVTAAVPAYVAYDLWGRGTVPEKKVELKRLPAIDPLVDLSALGNRARLSLRVENHTFSNLFIAQSYIRNVGKVPILPSDYTQPLTVSVKDPWRIIAIANSALFSSVAVQLRWKRVDNYSFEAENALLNPGDLVATYVYLTNSRTPAGDVKFSAPKPEIEWKARIVNLRSFHEPADFFDREKRQRWGIFVDLSGWSLLFTLAAALLYQALDLHLLARAELLRGWGGHSIIIVLVVSLIAFAAAESMATYLFGNLMTALTGVNHWLNAPPIVLHVLLLLLLFHRIRIRERAP